MQTRTRWMAGGVLAALIALGGAGLAIANGGDTDTDTPLAGTALERASRAALAHTGGGTVIETEVGDGGAAYGVEIRLDDGSVVEVQLDADFQVIGQQSDDDRSEGGGTDDDQ
jgi:uncharacterized membrane protein YkoI